MKHNVSLWLTAAVLVFALGLSAACAEVGELVAKPRKPGWTGFYIALDAAAGDFTAPAIGDGTVNPRALIASPKSAEITGPPIKVAVDSLLGDSAKLDLLRIDLGGKGLFQNSPTVPLDAPVDAVYEFEIGDKLVPAMASVYYQPAPNDRRLQLRLSTALEGKCQFADRVYPVAFIDRTSNLKCNDRPRLISKNGLTVGATNGDAVVIGDTASGPEAMAREFDFGQPVHVDGVWYDVKLIDGG